MESTNLDMAAASTSKTGIPSLLKMLEKNEKASPNGGTTPFSELLDKKMRKAHQAAAKASAAAKAGKSDQPATGLEIIPANLQGLAIEKKKKGAKQGDRQIQMETHDKAANRNSGHPKAEKFLSQTISEEMRCLNPGKAKQSSTGKMEEGQSESTINNGFAQPETAISLLATLPDSPTDVIGAWHLAQIDTKIESPRAQGTKQQDLSSVADQDRGEKALNLPGALKTGLAGKTGAEMFHFKKAAASGAPTQPVADSAVTEGAFNNANTATATATGSTPATSAGATTSVASVNTGAAQGEMISSSMNGITELSVARQEQNKESGFLAKVLGMLEEKNAAGAVKDIGSDIRQVIISNMDNKSHQLSRKESAFTEIQKEFSGPHSINQGAEALPTPIVAEQTALPEDATLTKFTNASAALSSLHDREQNSFKGISNRSRASEQDGSAFRMDMANIATQRSLGSVASDSPTTLNMQSVVDQIATAKQTMSNDFNRVRIILDPPNLGSVDLEIVVRRERVEIVMTAENANAQQALQARADDIRNALQKQDLKIEGFQVFLQDHGAAQQQAQGGAMFEQRRERQSRQETAAENVPALHSIPVASGMNYPDGRLSFFA